MNVGIIQSYSQAIGRHKSNKALTLTLSRFSAEKGKEYSHKFNQRWNKAHRWGRRDYGETLDPRNLLGQLGIQSAEVPPVLKDLSQAGLSIRIMADQIKNRRILSFLAQKVKSNDVKVQILLGGADHKRYSELKKLGVIKFLKKTNSDSGKVFYQDTILLDNSKVLTGKSLFVLGRMNKQFHIYDKNLGNDHLFNLSNFRLQFKTLWDVPRKSEALRSGSAFFTL